MGNYGNTAELKVTITGPHAYMLERYAEVQELLAQKISADLWDVMGQAIGTTAPANYTVKIESEDLTSEANAGAVVKSNENKALSDWQWPKSWPVERDQEFVEFCQSLVREHGEDLSACDYQDIRDIFVQSGGC